MRTPVRRVAVRGGRGVGKLLALDTPIPTPEGFKPLKEITEGSIVFDEQGRPCSVIETRNVLIHGETQLYQMI